MSRLPLALALALLLTSGLKAQENSQPVAAPPASTPTVTQPNETLPGEATDKQPKLEHIVIDREHGHIDVEAQVTLREGEWLELLACTKGKEHESILTMQARPSQVHLALLMLGLKPGHPMRWQRDDQAEGGYKIVEATGPKVAITLLYEKEGKTIEVPAHEWVVNRNTGKTLPDNIWLFTGSSFEKIEDEEREIYAADVNGTAITLVTFGDDLLARDTKMTNQNDEATWIARTRFIPPLETKVTIRLTPVKNEEGKSGKGKGESEEGKAESPEAERGKEAGGAEKK